MDPQRNHVTRDDLRSETREIQPPSSSSPSSSSGQTASDPRQPRYSDGFTVIPPKESQRRELVATLQKDEEKLQRWTEDNRVTHVHMEPETLGGHMTQAEVRQKQQTNQRSSKLQKKLKQEEQERMRRQEEEKLLQKMKDEQRSKSEIQSLLPRRLSPIRYRFITTMFKSDNYQRLSRSRYYRRLSPDRRSRYYHDV
ncbi:hypothetical protein JOB18_039369 [Solea senegalensis]|uniref:Epithelial stromal interaction 1 n=1 Tax=Solea senegalensis TaxID=28829 RepID=A0AAV6PJR8_SOLSE|nr:hypothetical protein JOB18_039369 [Solea senegalensis]